jgi:hypothetical protein
MGSKWPVQKEEITTRKRNREDWECGFLLAVAVIHDDPEDSQDQFLKKPSRDKRRIHLGLVEFASARP